LLWNFVCRTKFSSVFGLWRQRFPFLVQGCVLNSLAAPYNRGHHRFAVALAGITFLLLIAGALVTSNDAGLSVPDWPTSFGSYIKFPQWVGGIRYEHSHRVVAEFVGLLTIILAAWTWRVERRPWMKRLGLAALGTVILQGILGGITVLKFLPPAVSTAHAMVGQTFFCIVVSIALFSGQHWIEEHPPVAFDTRKPSLIALTQLSIVALYVQLFLGGMFRHHGMSWWPHVVNAGAVAVILTWTAVRALSQYADIEAVRRPAILLLSLMVAQLCLGFAAFITRVMWGRDAVQPEMPMIVSTVAHVATGALLLATAVVLAIQVWRHVPVALSEGVPRRPPRTVAA
jgi:heme a synthase